MKIRFVDLLGFFHLFCLTWQGCYTQVTQDNPTLPKVDRVDRRPTFYQVV